MSNSGDGDLHYRTSETMTAINTPNINFKWDPKSLEIRTLAVERLLEPLVTQVEISARGDDNIFLHCAMFDCSW